MDLTKIGKYIAEKRKALGLTQKQLAEKLGMSDKSVSKWERGICLPDVSIYYDLCQILGISINEFLAGEDISEEKIVEKSEENIIGVTTDSRNKQKRLKVIIVILLVISLAIVLVITGILLSNNRPKNYIVPLDSESIEMKTAQMLSGSDTAYIYKYSTTDHYDFLKIYVSEYHCGKLVNKDVVDLGYQDIESPQNGMVFIVPDFDNFVIKLIIADDNSKLSTEIPILEGVANREYYGRSATQIKDRTSIKYDEEQALAALIYDHDQMRVGSIQDYEQENAPEMNDYVYYFSFEFCKE